jgi:chromosomal replication initiator protein
LDCLLIDDIQFLMGKDSSQEEFFYTFNTLYESHKQIVICSDRPPRETQVGDRLVSRFEWGVIADVQPPDLETRIAILRKKTETSGWNVPEDVVLFVANHIRNNIRELEGAITRIMAYCSLTGAPLTVDTARRVLKDILTSPDNPALINADLVQRVVARHFNLDLHDMKSKRRTDAIAFPRQVAMFLVRTMTELSTPEIGAHFGGKDHTTVMHACNKIKNKLSGDPYFVALVNKITQDIREESLLTNL